MTTIVINENLKIPKEFNTFLEFFNYINSNIDVEINELEYQDTLLNSKEYNDYNDCLSKINF